MTTLSPPRADVADLAVVTPASPRRILLWDLPTRLFHWALVVAVCVAVVTAQIGGDWMKVHGWAGLTILGLVVFRLVWGFVGSTHSRFASFWPAPTRLRAYWQGRWKGVGHNPLGAIAIVVLLGLLAAQASTGLFSNDDIAFTGPWAGRVADELSQAITGWHRQLANVLYALAGLHVLAIAVYTWVKKRRLVGPMITGFKTLDDHDTLHAGESPRPARVAGWGAFAVALFAALSAVYLASGAELPSLTASAAVAPVSAPAKPAW